MSRRLHLPTTRESSPAKTPTVDDARRRLGGRARSEPGAGELVQVNTGDIGVAGVVLFVEGGEMHVLTGGNTVRKTRAEHTSALSGGAPPDLEQLASAIQRFDALEEGERVGFEAPGAEHEEGTLVEKCRYGGLVLRSDETILGVGFRRLWPVTAA